MSPPVPTAKELASFWAGEVTPEEFQRIDAWIATQSPATQEALITDVVTQAGDLAAFGPIISDPTTEVFRPEKGQRFRRMGELGQGGMGIVEAMHDRVLNREVAIKRLRPRAPQEALESYLARVQAFKREAAVTARLEHPGVVPVHDVGMGRSGEPAFAMKRLDGEPLAALVARRHQGALLDPVMVTSIIIRVAEAIGYAHAHGVVHRDVKPENIVVGQLGAVHVIDWGLAGHIGTREVTHPESATGPGTPQWMAPEQHETTGVDPRSDVFAIGGVLMALLTGSPPRPGAGRDIDLTPLAARGLPAGLVAVARRCLSTQPADRYENGEAVAADLQSWLSIGITQAQQSSWMHRGLATLRRSPVLLTSGAMVVAASLLIVFLFAWHHHLHEEEMRDRVRTLMTQVSLDDEDAVRTAHGELQTILLDLPNAQEARALDNQFAAALSTLSEHQRHDRLITELNRLAATYRRSGPWARQADELRIALRESGLQLRSDTGAADAAIVSHHPAHIELLEALVALEHAQLTQGDADVSVLPELLVAAGPTPGWRALGHILAMPLHEAHDLTFHDSADCETALAEPLTAEQVMEVFGPQPRLVAYALQRLVHDPGHFWSRVTCARSALMQGDTEVAFQHALVAVGAEPLSMWPHLIVAYVAMIQGHQDLLQTEADLCMQANPHYIECVVLEAVAWARAGRRESAQHLIDDLDAAHLQYHLQHPTGHPMDRSVQMLIAAGIHIRNAPPAIGPALQHNEAPQ